MQVPGKGSSPQCQLGNKKLFIIITHCDWLLLQVAIWEVACGDMYRNDVSQPISSFGLWQSLEKPMYPESMHPSYKNCKIDIA